MQNPASQICAEFYNNSSTVRIFVASKLVHNFYSATCKMSIELPALYTMRLVHFCSIANSSGANNTLYLKYAEPQILPVEFYTVTTTRFKNFTVLRLLLLHPHSVLVNFVSDKNYLHTRSGNLKTQISS